MVWAILMAAQGTPLGRFLNRVMVELPAAAFNRLQRGHVALAIVVTLVTIVAVSFQQPDSLRLSGLAIPDVAVWLTTAELGSYLDIGVMLIATVTAARRNNLWRRISGALSVLGGRRLSSSRPRPRARKQKAHRSPANDDEGSALIARAA